MNKYIVIAFAFMGFWFYEASGDADFEPGENTLVIFAEPKPVMPKVTPRETVVARNDTAPQLTEIVATRGSTPVTEIITSTDPTAGLSLVALQTNSDAEAPSQSTAVSETADSAEEQDPRDLRFVDGDRVNMRSGPGTDYAVVGKLLRDDMVEVLKDDGNGWLHLRDTASGQEGWMADWLVTASN